MTLFSYCIPYDNGAAPNPFWSVCTLAICKPVIRRGAKKGDWIVGTGSTYFGFENKVVYTMEVTEVMTFKEYDKYCKTYLPNKIPDLKSKDLKRRVGDCIYDYSRSSKPIQRDSVHNDGNIKTDLSGKNVLLSDHFYYFGSKPVPLKTSLLKIVRQGQGHKSNSNQPYLEEFIDWIVGFKDFKNKVNALPYGIQDVESDDCRSKCSNVHREWHSEDEKLNHLDC